MVEPGRHSYELIGEVVPPDRAGGETKKVAAWLAGADVGKKAPVNMDPEGGLHGKSDE